MIQASTAFWPGYSERIEIHGTKGSAIVTGDKLTTWDVKDDTGETAPIEAQGESGASDPMAISVVPFERQFLDFAEACQEGKATSMLWRGRLSGPRSCAGHLRLMPYGAAGYDSQRDSQFRFFSGRLNVNFQNS